MIRFLKVLSRILILLLLICIFFPSCQNLDEGEEDVANENKIEYPDQEGWDSTLLLVKEEEKSAVIHYGHMTKFEDKKMVYFGEGVKVDMYNPQGVITTKLISDSAQLNETNNEMEAIGNVKVLKNDTTFYTSSMKYSNVLTIDAPYLMVTAQKDTVWGKYFEYNPKTGRKVFHKIVGVSHQKIDFSGLESQNDSGNIDSAQISAVDSSLDNR